MKRKEQLKAAYDKACNDYLNELLKMWELDAYYGFWNSDQPGTIYHYGETHDLTMDEIIFCVDNSVPEDEVLAWEDYCLDAMEFGFNTPSLDAWHHGYPRVEPIVFERLRKMKQAVEDAVDEELERQRTKELESIRGFGGDEDSDSPDTEDQGATIVS